MSLVQGPRPKPLPVIIGVNKTLLGVDAIKNGKTVAIDINEQTLWDLLLPGEEAKILISPIGAQGFILGRGNQQISPRIVRRVGTGNIIVVATPHKLRETPVLYVDSGDSWILMQSLAKQSSLSPVTAWPSENASISTLQGKKKLLKCRSLRGLQHGECNYESYDCKYQ